MKGQVLKGRYKIIRDLAEGGFAQTYLAEDLQLPIPKHSKCVVKHLNPNNKDPLFTSKALELFKIEAETLQALGKLKHDQIPQLYASIQENDEWYLVLEFIDGHPISKEIPPGSQMAESRVAKLVRDVLEILVFVHSRGVIHRDIKPSNLIRRHDDDKIVLIDFGTVKQVQVEANDIDSSHKGTLPIGTPGYMSIDQSHGKSSTNSDIFALGMVALQALSGMHPSQFLRGDFGEIEWRSHAKVSDEFGAILDKMISYNPKLRYQTVDQVLNDLQHLPYLLLLQPFDQNSIQLSPSPLPISSVLPSNTKPRPTYNPWQIITGVGVSVIAAIAVINFLNPPSPPKEVGSSNPVASSSSTFAPDNNSSPASIAKPQLPKEAVDYDRLRSYLKQSNWQAADAETYNLMLRLAGDKSYGDGTFHPDELNNLSCAGIVLIDQLWLQASNGNLGFTAQKKIYESEGKDWQKMYSKVGWRSLTGEWLLDTRYDRQKYRWEYVDGRLPNFQTPPPGHLPFVFREESGQSLNRNIFLQKCF
ncbi:serine/threonine-protein kinase [Tumidithrix elongata RA019]|uniref:non-specific serine/threonine protein kinase n=1 Tax=Tumidithrix elongata BACA0141 TaxID=2716417 RepID=A0AAW9Q3P9_9CYAN|nr:serine/threonine-protein kinase [Tumidithrix elongata RA019]